MLSLFADRRFQPFSKMSDVKMNSSWVSKLNRAMEQRKELSTALEHFLHSDPYEVAIRQDEEKRLIYFVKRAETVPSIISFLAGETIHSLRSSLDHLAYELFIHNSGASASSKNIYFPIASSAERYECIKKDRTAGLSQNAIALIDKLEPFKGKNDVLWQINELDIIDKHRFLVTVGSSFQSMDLGAVTVALMQDHFPDIGPLPKMPAFFRTANNLFPLKSGDELFISGPGDKPVDGLQFRFSIVLSEPGIAEGVILDEIIGSMIKSVERLVPIFSSELLEK